MKNTQNIKDVHFILLQIEEDIKEIKDELVKYGYIKK